MEGMANVKKKLSTMLNVRKNLIHLSFIYIYIFIIFIYLSKMEIVSELFASARTYCTRTCAPAIARVRALLVFVCLIVRACVWCVCVCVIVCVIVCVCVFMCV